MARHPTSSRVHRDSSQGPDDAFVSGVERTVDWVRRNQRVLIVGGVVLLLVVAGAVYYINYQRTLENQAASRFTELQGTIASGNLPLAIRDLQTFVNRFGSTTAGEQARLVLADLLLQEDQPAQAVEALGSLPDNTDRALGLAAARLKAAALEATGNPEEAVSLYVRIADTARFPFQAREALADAARVRLQNGDPDGAADLFERLIATFGDADAPERGYYEMWLAEARARAGQGEAAPIDTIAS